MYRATVEPRSTDPASKWATNLARAARETEANRVFEIWKIMWFALHYPEHSCMHLLTSCLKWTIKNCHLTLMRGEASKDQRRSVTCLHTAYFVCTKLAMWRSKVLSSWNKLRQICEQAAIDLREEVARTARHCVQRWSFFSTPLGDNKDVVDIGLQFWDLWLLHSCWLSVLPFNCCLHGPWPISEASGRKSKMTMALRRWRQVLAQACFGLHETVRGRLLRWMINKKIGQTGMVVAWYINGLEFSDRSQHQSMIKLSSSIVRIIWV